MSDLTVALVLGLMLLGLLGTVVPLLPGLLLIWGAAVTGFVLEGYDGRAFLVTGLLTVLLVLGTAAKYVLPARAAERTPIVSLVSAVALGLVGLVTVPVVGFPLGAGMGFFLAETRRTRSSREAGAATWGALKAFGKGALLEIAAGVTMIATWWALRPR